ncbi:MAG: hypothetical protein WBD40_01050 [Tepidisphaeraceae bacterium]
MKLAMKLTFLALLVACGCAEHTQPDMEFPAEGAVRAPVRFADVQRSNGARGDGNLFAAHFTDDAVNSLGRAKLDVMIRDDETVRPVTIHMAPTKDMPVTIRRMESVTAYLKDAGLSDAQIQFETGLNEDSFHPAAPELANLAKMDLAEGEAAPAPAYGGGDAGVGIGASIGSMNR